MQDIAACSNLVGIVLQATRAMFQQADQPGEFVVDTLMGNMCNTFHFNYLCVFNALFFVLHLILLGTMSHWGEFGFGSGSM